MVDKVIVDVWLLKSKQQTKQHTMTTKTFLDVIDCEVRLAIKRETEKAWLVSSNDQGNKDVWFPKSVVIWM